MPVNAAAAEDVGNRRVRKRIKAPIDVADFVDVQNSARRLCETFQQFRDEIGREDRVGIADDTVTALRQEKAEIVQAVLVENGLAQKAERVKILGRGELKSKLDVKAHAFSATAKEAIESKGGSTSTI